MPPLFRRPVNVEDIHGTSFVLNERYPLAPVIICSYRIGSYLMYAVGVWKYSRGMHIKRVSMTVGICIS